MPRGAALAILSGRIGPAQRSEVVVKSPLIVGLLTAALAAEARADVV